MKLGEREGLADLERCIEITEPGSYERLRGFINLGSTLSELGELTRSAEVHAEGLREAERFGSIRALCAGSKAERAVDEFLTGAWTEASTRAEEFLAEVEGGQPHYMEVGCAGTRASQIRVARGDFDGALEDSERVLALQDVRQGSAGALSRLSPYTRASCSRPGGERTRCAHVDEPARASARRARAASCPSGGSPSRSCSALSTAQRSSQPALENVKIETRWQSAARAYAAGDFEEAAEHLGDMGARPDEAFARLRAAEAMAAAGRRPEADVQLERALAFYRSVGATVYIREAEGLFAASA